VEKAGASLVLVTHPKKLEAGRSQAEVTMDDMSGGACYVRFSHTVLCLILHGTISSKVSDTMGISTSEHNRTLKVLKNRIGIATGRSYAWNFETTSLTLKELGRIEKD
jgi:hypothetical protein